MIVVTCPVCATPFEIYPSGVGVRIHCSRACQGAARANSAARFWQHVATGLPDECWEWQGKRDAKNGYGSVGWNGKTMRAHRVALSLIDGDWSSRLLVCHTCDNPPCCNPAHLWRGTNHDNMLDKKDKNRNGHGAARGEKSGAAKLTAEQIRQIRGSPLSGNQLSRQYVVARNYIFAIKKRLTWRHIP
jgi:hypothetical protein